MTTRIFIILALAVQLIIVPGCRTMDGRTLSGKNNYFLVDENPVPPGVIADLEEKIREDKKEREDLLRLAVLYSTYANSRPDYEKAGNMLKSYRKLVSKGSNASLAEYLNHLIEEILKYKTDAAVMSEANAKSKTEIKRLRDRVSDLEKKLVNLKNLDIRLEKQRLGTE